jgi:hypothetical protein
MGDAHFSAYSRGGWFGDKDKRAEKEADLHQVLCNFFLELEAKKRREALDNKINEILRADQELGPLIGQALSNARRGVQPFGFIPKKSGKSTIKKIREVYPDVYKYIYRQYEAAINLDEKGLL